MEKTFVGRQPIYRDGVHVFAYELFSRNNELQHAAFVNGDVATAKALIDELVKVGLDRVVGPRPAFVNVTRDFVLSNHCRLIPKKNIVLQVSGEERTDDVLLRALSGLSRDGYSIAVTKFFYRNELRPLAEIANIVKLNVQALDSKTTAKHVQALRGLNVKLLAEGVETHNDYRHCKDLGFDYFEGLFFCKPQTLVDQPVPFNRLSTLYLLSKLQNSDISLTELEHAVGQDIAMSYRILRYLNSPINALPRKVTSIRHAISLVGTSLIRRWASMIWLANIEDKPRELMIMALIRAHMCEQLAAALGCRNVDQFFTAGLLSLLDALMDLPMVTVFQDLPLSDELKAALLDRSGLMGEAIKCIEAYERCDWNRTSFFNLDEKKIRDAYLSGLAWSRGVLQELVH